MLMGLDVSLFGALARQTRTDAINLFISCKLFRWTKKVVAADQKVLKKIFYNVLNEE